MFAVEPCQTLLFHPIPVKNSPKCGSTVSTFSTGSPVSSPSLVKVGTTHSESYSVSVSHDFDDFDVISSLDELNESLAHLVSSMDFAPSAGDRVSIASFEASISRERYLAASLLGNVFDHDELSPLFADEHDSSEIVPISQASMSGPPPAPGHFISNQYGASGDSSYPGGTPPPGGFSQPPLRAVPPGSGGEPPNIPPGGDLLDIYPLETRKTLMELATNILWRLYTNKIMVADFVEQMKNSLHHQPSPLTPNDPPGGVFRAVMLILMADVYYIPKFPLHEIDITARLFGGFIASQELFTFLMHYCASSPATIPTHIVLLRSVGESVRKPATSRMFLFGCTCLMEILETLPRLPSLCKQLYSTPSLCRSLPEITNYAKKISETISEAASENLMDVESMAYIPTSDFERLFKNTVFPSTPARSVEFTLQDQLEKNPQMAIGTNHLNNFVERRASMNTRQMQQHQGLSSFIQPSSTPLANTARGGIVEQKALPPALIANQAKSSFGSGHVEALIDVSGLSTRINEPSRQVQDLVNQTFNSLSVTNVDDKTKFLCKLLTESGDEFVPWFAYYLVKTRVVKEANLHDLYLSLVNKLTFVRASEIVLHVSYDCMRILLSYLKATGSAQSIRIALRHLGSWIGKLTLARGKPPLARFLDPKQLIFDAYETGLLQSVVPLVCRFTECIKGTTFMPPNPWTRNVLLTLWELHNTPNLKQTICFEIEILFKNLELDPAVECASQKLPNVLPTRQAPSDSPDFNDQGPPLAFRPVAGNSGTGLSELPQLASQQLSSQQQFSYNPTASPATTGSTTSMQHVMQQQMQPPPRVAPPAPTQVPVQYSQQAQQAPLQPAQQQPLQTVPQHPSRAVSSLPLDWSDLPMQLSMIVIPVEATLFHMRPEMKDLPARALERAIKEMGVTMVERSISVAASAAEALTIKDFANEPNFSVLMNAANAAAENLSVSLTLISCKESLRITFVSTLRELLQNATTSVNNSERLTPMIDQLVESVVQHNIDLGLRILSDVIKRKVKKVMEERLAPSAQIRDAYLKNPSSQQQPFLDSSRLDFVPLNAKSTELRSKLTPPNVREILDLVYSSYKADPYTAMQQQAALQSQAQQSSTAAPQGQQQQPLPTNQLPSLSTSHSGFTQHPSFTLQQQQAQQTQQQHLMTSQALHTASVKQQGLPSMPPTLRPPTDALGLPAQPQQPPPSQQQGNRVVFDGPVMTPAERIRICLQMATDLQKAVLHPPSAHTYQQQFKTVPACMKRLDELMSVVMDVTRQFVVHPPAQPLAQLAPLPRCSPVGTDLLLPTTTSRSVNSALSYLTSLPPSHELFILIRALPNFLSIVGNDENQVTSMFCGRLLGRVREAINVAYPQSVLPHTEYLGGFGEGSLQLEAAVAAEVYLTVLAGAREISPFLAADVTKTAASVDVFQRLTPGVLCALARYGLLDMEVFDDWTASHMENIVKLIALNGNNNMWMADAAQNIDFILTTIHKCYLADVVSQASASHYIFQKTLAVITNIHVDTFNNFFEPRNFHCVYPDISGLAYRSVAPKRLVEIRDIVLRYSRAIINRPKIATPRLVNNLWMMLKRRVMVSNKLPCVFPASQKLTPVGLTAAALSLYLSGNAIAAESVADPESSWFVAHPNISTKTGTYQSVFAEWSKVITLIIHNFKPLSTLSAFFGVLHQRNILNLDSDNLDNFFKASVTKAIYETIQNIKEFNEERDRRRAIEGDSFNLINFSNEKVPFKHQPQSQSELQITREADLWLHADALVRLPSNIMRVRFNQHSPADACVLFTRFCAAITSYAFDTGATLPPEVASSTDLSLTTPILPLPAAIVSENTPSSVSVDSFEPRILYHILSSFIAEISFPDRINDLILQPGLRAITGLLCDLSPPTLPNFAVFWLGLISNRHFILKMLSLPQASNRTWHLMARLISIAIAFLARICSDAENIQPAARQFALGVSRLMVILARDHSGFVAQFQSIWVPWIPPACTHLRNTINAAVAPAWPGVSPDLARMAASLSAFETRSMRYALPSLMFIKGSPVPSAFWHPLFVVNLNEKISHFFNESNLLMPKTLNPEEQSRPENHPILVLEGRLPKIFIKGHDIIKDIAKLIRFVPPTELLPNYYIDSQDVPPEVLVKLLPLAPFEDNNGSVSISAARVPIFPNASNTDGSNGTELIGDSQIKELKLQQIVADGTKATAATGFKYDRARVAALVTSVISDPRGHRNAADQAIAVECAQNYMRGKNNGEMMAFDQDNPNGPIDPLSESPYGEGISPSYPQPSLHARALFAGLFRELDTEGRYVLAAALVDGLRLPCLQTHVFMSVFMHCFTDCIDIFDNDPDLSPEELIGKSREGSKGELAPEEYKECLHEILVRSLIERLVTDAPHPWGIVVTLQCLLTNKRINITERKFLEQHPSVASLLEYANIPSE